LLAWLKTRLRGTEIGCLNEGLGREAVYARVSRPMIRGWSAKPSCIAMDSFLDPANNKLEKLKGLESVSMILD
jgi:hypothetical protein